MDETELAKIEANWEAAHNTVMVAPRRIGKGALQIAFASIPQLIADLRASRAREERLEGELAVMRKAFTSATQ